MDHDDAIKALAALALNLRSTWDHSADELWAQIDPELWAATSNPWIVVQNASPARLRELAASPDFARRLAAVRDRVNESLAAAAWFQRAHAASALGTVAYFSMEFALAESLPIYSGGLGNVAGDQLKAASDLGVPVVGVGLLYQQGYFRQIITPDGDQEALYPYNDPHLLPVSPVRSANGDVLRLAVGLPGQNVWLRAWQARVGRTTLYLLDANDPANSPPIRGITTELYGGGALLRLRQEVLLGIGGWRLLRAIGLSPDVCHLNEGHAAFAVLERAATFMKESGQPFDVALDVTRAGNLFTTHTPVSAGFDRFGPEIMRRFFGTYAEERLGISLDRLIALGRQNPGDPDEPFNMAYLALRGSGAVNGVSRLHGEVSRRIFQPLFPRWPQIEVPIGHVTNGVHTPFWDSSATDALLTKASGGKPWQGHLDQIEQDLESIGDEELWAMRRANRRRLVDYARERVVRQDAADGVTGGASLSRLDPEALTLGFARRFAKYKRPNLLLRDPRRLLALLTNDARPVQLIVAGKAHPADHDGQEMIEEWHRLIRTTAARGRVVFLADYDLLLAQFLVEGVDVWINTPRRPWEACGTSGMKVLANGGLNVSELDGWWAEAYAHDVGWAIGDGREHGDDHAVDAAEANALYEFLERDVVPTYYTRDARGIPAAWIAKMRASMGRLTPRFSANRAVREYTETYYLPAAERYRSRATRGGVAGAELLAWRAKAERGIARARFGAVRYDREGVFDRSSADVYLGDLNPELVRVELYAAACTNGPPERHLMKLGPRVDGGACRYDVCITTARPAGDYTPRLIPHHPAASVPLESNAIRWQR